jgi:hypothetical protein
MRIRDHLVPLGIALAALFGGGMAYAASSKEGEKKNGGGGKTAGVSRLVKKGGAQAMTHTGLSSGDAWAKDRYARSVALLKKIGLNDADAREMSLSALGHWAIETGSGDITTAGSHEYNFNVGGIHARDGDAYFDSVDAGVKTKFASYDSAEDGIGDYWALLASQYSSCLKQLKDAPSSDAWIRCIGQKGYYAAANIETMASGWKIRRAAYATSIHGIDGDEIFGAEDAKSYGPYSQDAIDSLLSKLRTVGSVTGSNPWTLEAGHGVQLQGTFNADSGMLRVAIVKSPLYVSNAQVWSKVDPLMPHGDRVFGDVETIFDGDHEDEDVNV